MTTISPSQQSEFLSKNHMLMETGKILKTEFAGIDDIIDEVIANISAWYVLPELQEKPVIINLWGLTGVGKTSLVQRMAELLNYSDRYYHFDLGEKESHYSFQNTLDELCDHLDQTPLIIGLDEFQHNRTVEENGMEVEQERNRLVWELVDTGKIIHYEWKRGLFQFAEMIRKLEHLVHAGVRISEGKVVNENKLFEKEMQPDATEVENGWFVPASYHANIIDFAGRKFNLELLVDVENYLKKLSAKETIHFLNQVYRAGLKPALRDFSKSLIFIMGNLDEAYHMSGNYSADMDADEFHALSLKINLPLIKKALKKRFRNEQIARLGNIHIIFPSLNRKSFEQIIAMEFRKITASIKKFYGIEIVFDPSVHDLIYREGVFPVQGTRPVYTSIHQIVKSRISRFIAVIHLKGLKTESIHMCISGLMLTGRYFNDTEEVFRLEEKIVTNLGDIRASSRDDQQAVNAVHESGHAVLSILLLGLIPEVVYSKTADADTEGFTFTRLNREFITKGQIISHAALMLGGLAAEKLVFGEDNITTGAESDIERATEFLGRLFKKGGMGSIQGHFCLPNPLAENCFHQYGFIEDEMRTALHKAVMLAENSLKESMALLLGMADFLSDYGMLRKHDIEGFIEKTGFSTIAGIEATGRHDFSYRKHLKKKLNDQAAVENFRIPLKEFILNKNKKHE